MQPSNCKESDNLNVENPNVHTLLKCGRALSTLYQSSEEENFRGGVPAPFTAAFKGFFLHQFHQLQPLSLSSLKRSGNQCSRCAFLITDTSPQLWGNEAQRWKLVGVLHCWSRSWILSVELKKKKRRRRKKKEAAAVTCQDSQNGPSGPPARLLSWEWTQKYVHLKCRKWWSSWDFARYFLMANGDRMKIENIKNLQSNQIPTFYSEERWRCIALILASVFHPIK